MTRILITGMSGTGKSTLIQELHALGYKTIDMDYDDWSEYRSDGEWIWKEDRISEVLNESTNELLFIAGCASNQGKFYSKFDFIILLSTPEEVLIERLQKRTNNPYGKKLEEFDKIIHDLRTIEPLLRKGSNYEFKTDKPIEEIIQNILSLVKKA